MGYTHYWSFEKAPKGQAAEIEARYRAAIVECQKVLHAYQRECKEAGLDDYRLSGYSAHAKPGAYGGLNVNGKGDLGWEDFTMREHFSENDTGLNFCKTNRNPYDVAVTACLAILAYRLPGLIRISSDGRAIDWLKGVTLASKVLRRKVGNPIAVKLQKVA